MPKAYYNEIDKFSANWLRELIADGLIADGYVDERSIEDVPPCDLVGFTQAHFFAGVGGWSYALRLAGWPDSEPVWTGSCPCQPFSQSGKGLGFNDKRHLWPAWRYVISECKPDVVFGEQVASPDGLSWLDVVQADMENAHYCGGAVDLCAAGVGAPHPRQRLWLVFERMAYTDRAGLQRQRFGGHSSRERIARTSCVGDEGRNTHNSRWSHQDRIRCRNGRWRPVKPGLKPLVDGLPGSLVQNGFDGEMENPDFSPFARKERIIGYGNAIVPQVAANVIRAYMEARQ